MHIYSLLAPASKKLRGGNQDDPFDECVYIYIYWASQVALVLKNPPANAADARHVGSTLGQEDPL